MTKNEKSTQDTTPCNKLKIQQCQTQLNNKPKMEKRHALKQQKVNNKDFQKQNEMLGPIDFSYLYQNLEDEKRDLQIMIKTFVEYFKNGNYSKKDAYAMRLFTLKLAMTCFNYSEELKDSEFPGAFIIPNELNRTLREIFEGL